MGGGGGETSSLVNNNEFYRTITPSSKTVRSIAELPSNSSFCIVLMTDNTIYSIGENYWGQLGIGTTVDSYEFKEMTNNTGKTPLHIVCGTYYTLILNTDGTIYGTGQNTFGQLGDETTTDRSSLVELSNNTGKIPQQVKCGTNFTIILIQNLLISSNFCKFGSQITF